MKDKIIEILEHTVGIGPNGLSLMNLDKSADMILQLMCDREAEIMFNALCYPATYGIHPDTSILLVREELIYNHDFKPDQIEKAIEKLK